MSSIRLSFLLAALAWAGSVWAQNATEPAAAAAATPAATAAKKRWVPVAEAAKAAVGSEVYVRGRVLSVVPPRPNSQQPWSIYLGTEAENIRIVIFPDVWATLPDTSFIQAGAAIDVFGKVGTFGNTPQIVIPTAKNIRKTPGTEIEANTFLTDSGPVAVKCGDLTVTLLGKMIRVEGTVKEVVPPHNDRSPYRVTVQDETGEIEAVYWKQVADKLAPGVAPEVGKPINVNGLLAEYRGKLQLRVEDAANIQKK